MSLSIWTDLKYRLSPVTWVSSVPFCSTYPLSRWGERAEPDYQPSEVEDECRCSRAMMAHESMPL